MQAPPNPVPIPAPRVSVRRIEESWLASVPPDAWLIAARGMVGNATPIPSPARAQPMYGTMMGTDVRPAATPAIPTATTLVPAATRVGAPIRPIVRDCHQLPRDQATVASVTTMPASATDNPRTPVSIRGTKPSTAKNAADSRNAAAAVAGRPGLALNQPEGAIRASAGRPRTRPAGIIARLHHEGSVSPARNSPAPTISWTGHRMDSRPA